MTFEVLCNSTKDTLVDSDFSIVYTDRCNPIVTFSHFSGCPIKASYYVEPEAVVAAVPGYPWLFAIFFIFLILIGPVINFFGKRFFKQLINLTGLLIGGGLALTMIYASSELDDDDSTMGLYFISLLIISVTGGFLGYVLSTFLFAGLFVASTFGGVIAADLLFNLVFIGWANSLILLAALIITFGALAGAASFFKQSLVMILATSLIGAFFLIRGLAFFIGGYTDEMTLYTQLKSGSAAYSTTFLAYLAIILVLFASGYVY